NREASIKATQGAAGVHTGEATGIQAVLRVITPGPAKDRVPAEREAIYHSGGAAKGPAAWRHHHTQGFDRVEHIVQVAFTAAAQGPVQPLDQRVGDLPGPILAVLDALFVVVHRQGATRGA